MTDKQAPFAVGDRVTILKPFERSGQTATILEVVYDGREVEGVIGKPAYLLSFGDGEEDEGVFWLGAFVKAEEISLDAGIHRTVAWLNSQGFPTSDSGDGRSKRGTDAEACMWDVPNVTMPVYPPESLLAEAKRLLAALCKVGLDPDASGVVDEQEVPLWQIEAIYLPAQNVAFLQLTGVDDSMLGLTPPIPSVDDPVTGC